MMFGCSVAGRLQRQQMTASLSQLTRAERQERQQDYRPQVVKLQRDSNTFFLAPVDTLADGERVMALQIEQVTVVAKMRSIPERNGRVVLDFIVTLPKQLLGRSRSVVITPILHKPDESVALEDLVIRGGRFSLLQERDYWQYETYVERFRPDTVGREAAFNRFVKFPYPEDVRLDSLVEGRSTVTYYYSQEVKTDETSKKMLVTLQGQVLAVDDSAYRLPPSDTLSYVVSSMLSFVDTMPRYRIKVIDKFVTVEDRNYIQFFVGDTRVVDTLGDNRQQLDKITGLMTGADDYMTKPFSPAELTARIDALYRRIDSDGSSNQIELKHGPFVLNTRNRTLDKEGRRIKLTQVEYAIVKLFMQNPGRALSREDILAAVWGRDYDGELKIVDVNIRRLRIKIEDDTANPTYITTVWGFGYKWGA